MPRSDSDAVASRPTVEQEMSTFKGFSTENGETITDPSKEDLNPVAGKNMSAAEIAKAAEAAGAAKEKPADAAKTPAAKELTAAESDKVIADLDAKLGREATDAEVDKAISDAKNTKNGSGASNSDKKSAARYNTMKRERESAIRRADALEARLAALEAAKAPEKAAVKDEKLKPDGSPDPTKFEFGELDSNYIRALARFETKQELLADKEANKTAVLTDQQKADKVAFETARDAFEDKGTEQFDDFTEVVMDGARTKAWPLSDALGGALLTSEFGPQIAYELASDIKEAKRISEMPPTRQIAWLGRKEAELESLAGSGANGGDKGKDAEAAAKAKSDTKVVAKESKAPAPVTRVRGQGSASTVPGDTNDFAAFEAAAMGRRTK